MIEALEGMTMPIDWSAIISNITWQSVANSLINIGITGTLFWGALRLVATKTIDYKVNRKMQVHKEKLDEQLEAYKIELQRDIKFHEQKLQVMTEGVKFDFARRQQDFGLYSTKRHEVYLKLHQALAEAQSRVIRLRGYRELSDYSKYSKEEIKKWLDDNGLGQEQKDTVLSRWDSDKTGAVAEVHKLLKLLEEYQASVAIGEANNILIEFQLYMSDIIVFAVRELVKNLKLLLINYKSLASVDVTKLEEQRILKIKIEEEVDTVTGRMKQELKKGYYDDEQ